MPAHPLIVHAAVVFTPLAVIAVVLFAVVRRWRYLTRWPAVVLAAISFVVVWIAKITGDDLRESNFGELPHDNPIWRRLDDHQAYADVLGIVAFALLLLVGFGAWLLGGPSGFTSGRGAKPIGPRYIELALPLALVVVAAVAGVYVYLTGDAGAHAVWAP